MPDSYREQFEDQRQVTYYDTVQYGPGSYGHLLWEIEQTQLDRVLSSMGSKLPNLDYLDFAAGTGRITCYMETKVRSSRGIEISEAMASEARRRVTRSDILCVDITDPAAPLEGQYDLITAFRFFLNAEPPLRVAAMKALSRRLRDKNSLLVFNNHGNAKSLKAITWALRRRPPKSGGWDTSGNVMTDKEAFELLEAAGLEIVDVFGCGILTFRVARLLALVSPDFARTLEVRLSNIPCVARFGVNRTYIARLNGEGSPDSIITSSRPSNRTG